jgi:hypothetical protein
LILVRCSLSILTYIPFDAVLGTPSVVLQILGSKVVDGYHTEGIDEKTILQVNGSMVVGALFVLTLSSFIPAFGGSSRNIIGFFTIAIIAPFILSTLFILRLKPNERQIEQVERMISSQ